MADLQSQILAALVGAVAGAIATLAGALLVLQFGQRNDRVRDVEKRLGEIRDEHLFLRPLALQLKAKLEQDSLAMAEKATEKPK